jgi:tetratricopeptide (TPR) repeat protein
MMHDPWTDRLSEYLDGELSGAERAALERHLAACPTCTAVLADLERVVARARSLTAEAPGADLWSGISAQIAAAARPATVRPIRHRRVFSLPQLAAAALAAAVASGGLAWWWAVDRTASALRARPHADAPVPGPAHVGVPMGGVQPAALAAERKYDAAVADLERVLAQGRGRLDPKTVTIVEQNLARIDQAIADARRALAADPNNAYLNAHLARAMRWKIDLLRQAAGLAVRQS